MHDSLMRESYKLRTKAKLMPAFNTLASRALPVAGAGFLGWEIGTAVRSIFVDAPMPTATNLAYVTPFSEGDGGSYGYTFPYDGFAAHRQQYGGATATELYTTPDIRPPMNAVVPDGFHRVVVNTMCSVNCYGHNETWTWEHIIRPAKLNAPSPAPKPGIPYAPRVSHQNGDSAATTRDKVMTELTENPSEYPTLAQWLDSQLGGPSSDPIAETYTMPQIAPGDTWTTYRAKVIELDPDVTIEREILSPAEADIEKDAGAIILTSPAPGSVVEIGREGAIVLTTNPDEDDMPFKMPGPEVDETWEQYNDRLDELGHTGTRTRIDLSDTTLDPAQGPSAVTGTTPGVNTRVTPDTPLKIRVNPETAPEVTGSGGGSMPEVPPINFDPLMAAGTCTNFPFGIPCWIYESVSEFVGDPVTPEVSFHFPYGGDGNNTTISMEMFDPYMAPIRTVIGIGICGSMLWLFYGLAFGGAIGGGRNDGSK